MQRAGHRLGLLGQRVAHRADRRARRPARPAPSRRRWCCTIHSARLQAAVEVHARRGSSVVVVEPVVGEPHRVGDLGVLLAAVGAGVGLLRRRSGGRCRWRASQFSGPSYGCIIACIWLISADEVGHARRRPARRAAPEPPAPAERVEDLLERRALERVVVRSAGVVAHGSKLPAAAQSPPGRCTSRRSLAA